MAAKTASYFRTIRIIHSSFLVGLLSFAATIFFLVRTGKFLPVCNGSVDKILQIAARLVAGILLMIGFELFRKKIIALHQSPDSAEKKLDQYRSACISWWAIVEIPGIVAIISFLLTSHYAFFALACFHIIVLTFFISRKDNIILLLNLSMNEAKKLEEKKIQFAAKG